MASIEAARLDKGLILLPPKTRSSSAIPRAGCRPKIAIYIASLYDDWGNYNAIMYQDMSFRSWATIVTLILLGLVVFFGWPEISHAWSLLGRVNIWILLLLIPIQLLSYYAVGDVIFSYIRSKGDLIGLSKWTTTRWALELNFVNHILPSGGAAGFSYLGWVLSRHGVSSGRAAMAQIIRFALMFLAFICLLFVALMVLILDHQVNRIIILLSFLLTVAAIGGTLLIVYTVGNKTRLIKFSGKLAKLINRIVLILTFGKKRNAIKKERVEGFFNELHVDYIEIRKNKRILKRPFLWAIVANASDILLISIAFWALGTWVSPAVIFVAFGVTATASFISVTPGGAGVYETIMIAFLVSAGVSAEVAIAGTLLARVVLLSGTIIFGYIFYQLTILKYGKSPIKR